MPSIIETYIAHQMYMSIDATGNCTHACNVDAPFRICEIEADDIFKFDPDTYKALIKFGVKREEFSLVDIAEVGRRQHLLTDLLKVHGDGRNDFLYKYAMSARIDEPLAISSTDPFNSLHKECTKKFKNKIKEY